MSRSAIEILSSWKAQFDPREELVKAKDAAKGNHAFASIEKAPCIWVGVRGSNYNQELLAAIPEGETTGTLVPEPDNAFDPLAVAIYVQGLRIGYLSSRMAANYQTTVAMMRNLGHPMSVRVKISRESYVELMLGSDSEIERVSFNAHACVPSLRRLDKLVPKKVIYTSLRQLWDQISDDTRNQIIADRYHLTQATGEEILANRHLAPDYCFPTRFDVELQDAVFNRFLQETRVSNNKKAKKKLAVRNARIHKLHLAGRSNKEIASEFGLKPGTIRGIIHKLKSNAPASPQ